MKPPGARNAARKGRILALACAVLLVQALLLIGAVLMGEDASTAKSPPGPAETADNGGAKPERRGEEPAPIEDEILYSYDIQDERIVIGLSENVFAGRVGRKVGEEPAKTTIPGDAGRPQAQYSVSVLASAKATGPAPVRAGEGVVVNQEVGEDHKTGRVVPIVAAFCGSHASDELLVPGAVYVFATYYEPSRKLQTLTAQPTGNVRTEDEDEARMLLSAYDRYAAEQVDPATGEIQGSKPCG
jgi:hypothetical protein